MVFVVFFNTFGHDTMEIDEGDLGGETGKHGKMFFLFFRVGIQFARIYFQILWEQLPANATSQ